MIYYINEYRQPKLLKDLKVDAFLRCDCCKKTFKFKNFGSVVNAYKYDTDRCLECCDPDTRKDQKIALDN